jgi:hypothetical protein
LIEINNEIKLLFGSVISVFKKSETPSTVSTDSRAYVGIPFYTSPAFCLKVNLIPLTVY